MPEVGAWAEKKYRLIATFSEMFARAMKGKWDSRVYVDLFAAAGRARVRGSGQIVPTSATLALSVREPFDKYVFCELERANFEALRARVSVLAPSSEKALVQANCNSEIDRILAEIPTPRRGRTVLTFCVVDPFKLSALKFSTLAALAERFVDFLVLIPSHMDAHRNLGIYIEAANSAVADFLGDPKWRDDWAIAASGPPPHDFGTFVVDRFGRAMRSLGFLYEGPAATEPVRDKHLLLYHLAFFSRSERGRDFWNKARRHSIDQLSFDV